MAAGGLMKDAGAVATAPAYTQTRTVPRWVRGVFELLLILALWFEDVAQAGTPAALAFR